MEDAPPDASDRLVDTLLSMENGGLPLDARGQAATLAALVRIADALVSLSGAVHPATKHEREDLTKRVMATVGAVKTAIDTVINPQNDEGGDEK
jgi:hypothetical protein